MAKTTEERENEIRTAVQALAEAHRKLDERLDAVLWLKTKTPGVWILEVMPDMPPDAHAERPMEFSPSKDFRYTLNLLLGRDRDFRNAVRRNTSFARAVAAAEPILPHPAIGKKLIKYAESELQRTSSMSCTTSAPVRAKKTG